MVISLVQMVGAAGGEGGVNQTYIGPHIVNDLGFSVATAGLALSVFTVGSVVGPLGFGWLSDRVPRHHVIQTSLVLSVPNKAGAVYNLLAPLARHGVSMTRFESRPARSGQWEYYFYIDLQGHPSQPHVAAALKDLQSLCAFYKVLGTYPLGE